MSDIFISYASIDRPRVKPLVEALKQRGWSVWWDRTILAGKTFDRVIEAALKDSRCVIVLWSRDSIESHWVKTEADEGRRRGILVPAMLDDVPIPLAFRIIHAANLIGWSGASPSDQFEELTQAVSDVLSNARSVHEAKQSTEQAPQERDHKRGDGRDSSAISQEREQTESATRRRLLNIGVIGALVMGVVIILTIAIAAWFKHKDSDPLPVVTISNNEGAPPTSINVSFKNPMIYRQARQKLSDGIGELHFGMSWSDVNAKLAKPSPSPNYESLPVATEYKTVEVRYLWVKLFSIENKPELVEYRSLLEPFKSCMGEGSNSYVTPQFQDRKLIRVSTRFFHDCPGRDELFHRFIESLGLSVALPSRQYRVNLVIGSTSISWIEGSDFSVLDVWKPTDPY